MTDKEFLLEYTERKGTVYDVREVTDRDIDGGDIALEKNGRDMLKGCCIMNDLYHAWI